MRYMPIRLRLRELRERADMTQDQLAAASGVSQSAVSQIERGTRPNVTLEVVEKLANALGVPAAELIVHTPPPRRRA